MIKKFLGQHFGKILIIIAILAIAITQFNFFTDKSMLLFLSPMVLFIYIFFGIIASITSLILTSFLAEITLQANNQLFLQIENISFLRIAVFIMFNMCLIFFIHL